VASGTYQATQVTGQVVMPRRIAVQFMADIKAGNSPHSQLNAGLPCAQKSSQLQPLLQCLKLFGSKSLLHV
jgi:hypothetical protein